MIALMLWSLRWRLVIVAVLCFIFYLYEPGFHLHGEPGPDTPPELLDPGGIAFTLANLAGAAVLVLLAGFVSTDRRRGYYGLLFSHPTRPLAYYGLRWAMAYALALAAAALFMVLGQLAAWGELRAGAETLEQAAVMALIYGGLTAFLSVVLPRGDALVALCVFFATEFWQLLLQTLAQVEREPLAPWITQAVSFVLPPHLALNDVYNATTLGTVDWGAVVYAGGYGLFWLILAGLLLRLREWP